MVKTSVFSAVFSPRSSAWATPKYGVVSGGRRALGSGLREAYARVGAAIYHTADQGAVTVTLAPAGVTLETFLDEQQGAR